LNFESQFKVNVHEKSNYAVQFLCSVKNHLNTRMQRIQVQNLIA